MASVIWSLVAAHKVKAHYSAAVSLPQFPEILATMQVDILQRGRRAAYIYIPQILVVGEIEPFKPVHRRQVNLRHAGQCILGLEHLHVHSGRQYQFTLLECIVAALECCQVHKLVHIKFCQTVARTIKYKQTWH